MTERNHHTISNLEQALKTYRERNRMYGNNYKRFGSIMHALYPNGITINSAHQWNRFGIIVQKVSKLSRYVTDPINGHLDSIHDDGVYSFMLEELDAEQAKLDVKSPIPLVTVKDQPIGYKIYHTPPESVLPNPCEHVYRSHCPTDEQQCDNDCKANDHIVSCIRCGDLPEYTDQAEVKR